MQGLTGQRDIRPAVGHAHETEGYKRSDTQSVTVTIFEEYPVKQSSAGGSINLLKHHGITCGISVGGMCVWWLIPAVPTATTFKGTWSAPTALSRLSCAYQFAIFKLKV